MTLNDTAPCGQVAILAGDFLLARASVTLAALRDSEVIQLLSQVIEDLVTGEILQARAGPPPPPCAERGAGMQELPVVRQCLVRQRLEAVMESAVIFLVCGAGNDCGSCTISGRGGPCLMAITGRRR